MQCARFSPRKLPACIYTAGRSSRRVRLIRQVDPCGAAIAKIPHWLPSGTSPENSAKIGFRRLREIFGKRINSKSYEGISRASLILNFFSANLLKLSIANSWRKPEISTSIIQLLKTLCKLTRFKEKKIDRYSLLWKYKLNCREASCSSTSHCFEIFQYFVVLREQKVRTESLVVLLEIGIDVSWFDGSLASSLRERSLGALQFTEVASS